jgi:hypothetical protein
VGMNPFIWRRLQKTLLGWRQGNTKTDYKKYAWLTNICFKAIITHIKLSMPVF